MNRSMKALFFLAFLAAVVLNVFTHAASIADSGEFELYNPSDINVDEGEAFLNDLQKRMGCRPGYTYQAILRDCVPSLGALRGRGRGRGRGGRFRN